MGLCSRQPNQYNLSQRLRPRDSHRHDETIERTEMKLIEKFMLKRCSTEVQLMLTRMKERPEDFDYGTGWKKLVEVADNERSPYTNIERKMIRKYWKECQVQRDRKKLLAQIMQQTINPTTREDIEDGVISKRYSQALAASMQATKQTLRGGVPTTGYTDPRAMYGSDSGAQGAYGIYANPHSRNPFQNSTAP